MNRTNRTKLPRADVGGGTLSGVVVAFAMMILSQNRYNFFTVAALVGVCVQGLAGYLPGKDKNFWMGSAAVVGTIVAAVVGKLFFGQAWDNVAVSAAIGLFVPAFVAYLAPARDPEAPPVVVVKTDPPDERVGQRIPGR